MAQPVISPPGSSEPVADAVPDREQSKISVVVAAFDARESIVACLQAVLGAPYDGRSEVIVVDSSTDGTAQIVAQRFPEAQLVTSERRLFPGEARNRGLARSRGEIVVFIDADCVPQGDWLNCIARAHEAPTLAIGGSIENGNRSFAGRTSYFCKLAKWMPRAVAEPVGDLPSECLAVKRSALTRYGPFLEATYSSATAFSWRLTAEGHAPWLDPSIRVSRVSTPTLREFLTGEPRHGRYFASVRAREQRLSTARRLTFALLSPALPFVLFARSAARVLRHPRYATGFLAVAPAVFLGFATWSYGEFRGYLAGPLPESRQASRR